MACPNNFVFFICIIILFSLSFSNTVHDQKEDSFKDADNKENGFECQKRKVENYITLPPNPKTWVDPWADPWADLMIRIPGKESQEDLVGTTEERSDFSSSYPILEADDQPLFSDVNGNVIIEKVHTTPHRNVFNDLDSGGFLHKDQQKVSVLDTFYISQWLEKLIYKIENEANQGASAVSFQLDSIVLNNLKEMSAAKSLKVTELDNLISNLLSQMVVVPKKEANDCNTLRDYCTIALWVIVNVVIFWFIMYGLHSFFKLHPKLMFFFCGLAVFVLWHGVYLYQHIKAYNHAELSLTDIPDECKKHNFQLLEHVQEYIASYFIYDECKKHYEPFLIHSLFEMSFNVTVVEFIKVILFPPLSFSSQINCDMTQVHDNELVNILSFFVLLFFLSIIVYCYGIKQFYKSAFLLLSKFFKPPSSIQSICMKATRKRYSDDYASSNSFHRQNRSSNGFFFRNIDTDPIQSNVPENFFSPEFSSDNYDAHDQSCSEDDNSYTNSDSTSWSDSSFDSQDCACCINDSELIRELHVGCRVCDNNNAAATGSAGTSRDDSFKNESADFTDQPASVQLRDQISYKGETSSSDSENSPQSIRDPSAG